MPGMANLEKICGVKLISKIVIQLGKFNMSKCNTMSLNYLFALKKNYYFLY